MSLVGLEIREPIALVKAYNSKQQQQKQQQYKAVHIINNFLLLLLFTTKNNNNLATKIIYDFFSLSTLLYSTLHY